MLSPQLYDALFFVVALPLAALVLEFPFPVAFSFAAASFSVRKGQSRLGQTSQGPRRVEITILGAPQASQSSPVASSVPRWGSG